MPQLIAAFLRHSDYFQLQDAPSALQPFSLTTRGKQQAQEAAHTIQTICHDNGWTLYPVIDSSNLLRAWQTADIIKQQWLEDTSVNITVDSFTSLCERSVGALANLTTAQIEQVLQQDPRYETPPQNWKSNSHYCLPFQGAESLMQSGQRVADHIIERLKMLQSDINTDTVKLFVGHGASFRHAACLLNILSLEQIAQLSMYHAQPLFFEYHSDQTLEHIGGDWKIRGLKENFTD